MDIQDKRDKINVFRGKCQQEWEKQRRESGVRTPGSRDTCRYPPPISSSQNPGPNFSCLLHLLFEAANGMLHTRSSVSHGVACQTICVTPFAIAENKVES